LDEGIRGAKKFLRFTIVGGYRIANEPVVSLLCVVALRGGTSQKQCDRIAPEL
jgi:hypothetical protein